jgi:hypothetical protein
MGKWMYGSKFSWPRRKWTASRPSRFILAESSNTYWIGGSVDPRAYLDNMEKWKLLTLPGLRPLGRPTQSQSLCRLRYRDSRVNGPCSILCDHTETLCRHLRTASQVSRFTDPVYWFRWHFPDRPVKGTNANMTTGMSVISLSFFFFF